MIIASAGQSTWCFFLRNSWWGYLALGCVGIWIVTISNIDVAVRLKAKNETVYAAISLATNMLLAILLTGRILWAGRKYRQVFGTTSNIGVYTSPAAMIAESAALYTVPLLIGVVIQFTNYESFAWAIPIKIAEYMAVGQITFSPSKVYHHSYRASLHFWSPTESSRVVLWQLKLLENWKIERRPKSEKFSREADK